jgi:hypothetical protein
VITVKFGFSIISFILGLYLILSAHDKYSLARKARKTWFTTSGIILDSKLNLHAVTSSNRSNVKLSYAPKVTYQYQVLNQTYTGERLAFDSITYSFEELSKKPQRPQTGETVLVFYDPADPTKSVLEPKTSIGGNLLIFGTICLVCGLCGLHFFYP